MMNDPFKEFHPSDDQSRDIMKLWEDRQKGKITHDAMAMELRVMFSGRMMELWRLWINGGLFITQNFKNLDQFLKMDERDRYRDYKNYNEFIGVYELTQEKNPELALIEKHYLKWVRPSMEYRKQFLNDQGQPVRQMEDREGEKEYTRLRGMFN